MEVLPLSVSSTATHYIYIRKHQAQSGGPLPEDRTLFVANLPIDCTERRLAHFFKTNKCGNVERVVFGGSRNDSTDGSMAEDEEANAEIQEDETPIASSSKVTPLPSVPASFKSSGHTAHVIFLDATSVSTALSLAASSASSTKRLKWAPAGASSSKEPTGLQRLISQYDALHPPLSTSRSHSDTYIAAYEARIEAAKLASQQNSKYKKGEAIVDDDGFTLVTRGGAYGATLGGGAGVASRQFQLDANSGKTLDVEKRKRKKKEKPDFYKFQVRERKRKDFMDLRRKFEEDKAKIAKLKESRRFKPY